MRIEQTNLIGLYMTSFGFRSAFHEYFNSIKLMNTHAHTPFDWSGNFLPKFQVCLNKIIRESPLAALLGHQSGAKQETNPVWFDRFKSNVWEGCESWTSMRRICSSFSCLGSKDWNPFCTQKPTDFPSNGPTKREHFVLRQFQVLYIKVLF